VVRCFSSIIGTKAAGRAATVFIGNPTRLRLGQIIKKTVSPGTPATSINAFIRSAKRIVWAVGARFAIFSFIATFSIIRWWETRYSDRF